MASGNITIADPVISRSQTTSNRKLTYKLTSGTGILFGRRGSGNVVCVMFDFWDNGFTNIIANSSMNNITITKNGVDITVTTGNTAAIHFIFIGAYLVSEEQV